MSDYERAQRLGFDERIINRDYIKRVVALPGDTVEMRSGRLFLNGELVPRVAIGEQSYLNSSGRTITANAYREILPGGMEHTILDMVRRAPRDEYGPVTIPEGSVFLMGDNRDNSTDARFFGPVPIERLVGKAHFIAFSVEPPMWHVWRWPFTARYERFFQKVE
jgi:signal peptidase I